jgi:pectinesterase inhibitor-like protein
MLASMRVAEQQANEAKAKVDAYEVRSHTRWRLMASIISTCSKSYDDVAQSLEEAWGLVEAHGTQFVGFKTKVSATTMCTGDCSTTFKDFPDIPSPFAAMQKNVFRVVDNVLKQQAKAHAHGTYAH